MKKDCGPDCQLLLETTPALFPCPCGAAVPLIDTAHIPFLFVSDDYYYSTVYNTVDGSDLAVFAFFTISFDGGCGGPKTRGRWRFLKHMIVAHSRPACAGKKAVVF